jgi:hypothetical protein
MSLSNAIDLRNAFQEANALPAESLDEETEFMPVSCVEDLIRSHPVSSIMRPMKLEEIHKCMCHIFTKYKKEVKTKKLRKETSNIKKQEHFFVCRLCSGTICEFNYRDGDIVCVSCGAVDRVRLTGESFQDDSYESNENFKADSDMPQWLLAQSAYGHTSYQEAQISKEINHYNKFIHILPDELDLVKHLANLMDKRASDNSRISAAFIVFYLIKKYDITTITFDESVRLSFQKPQPISSCETCQENFFHMYQKRRHKCMNKRRRREQWSLVKNKKTKMKFI